MLFSFIKKLKNDFVVFLILISYLVFTRLTEIKIPCIFEKITGLFCPGCGISRMFIAMSKLEFYQAFRYNPLIFIMTPFFIIFFLEHIISKAKNKESIIQRMPNIVWYSCVVVIIIYGIIRNIPYFDYLKPTNI